VTRRISVRDLLGAKVKSFGASKRCWINASMDEDRHGEAPALDRLVCPMALIFCALGNHWRMVAFWVGVRSLWCRRAAWCARLWRNALDDGALIGSPGTIGVAPSSGFKGFVAGCPAFIPACGSFCLDRDSGKQVSAMMGTDNPIEADFGLEGQWVPRRSVRMSDHSLRSRS